VRDSSLSETGNGSVPDGRRAGANMADQESSVNAVEGP
jgi:hypothetical protein